MGVDPQRIGRFAVSYLRGARMAGVISVIKHFPGHGSSTVDSHGYLPVVDLATRDLMERDFKPFRMAIDDGAEALMTAHILFPRLDPRLPVTLSPAILRNLLRRRFGFSGVVISDGLSMGAIAGSFPLRETLKLLFQAGVDLILVHDRYDVFELKREVLALLEEGSIREAWIDEGVRRVLELKNRYGLLPACP
jgi:beta-N-acetylhexosaminidase